MAENNSYDDQKERNIGARNYKGEESEQSKARRHKNKRMTDEETVNFLRKRRGRA